MTGYISERDYNNEFLSFLRKEDGLKYFNIFSNIYETAENDPIENLFNKLAVDVIKQKISEQDLRELENRYDTFEKKYYSDEESSDDDYSDEESEESDEDSMESESESESESEGESDSEICSIDEQDSECESECESQSDSESESDSEDSMEDEDEDGKVESVVKE